MSLGSSYPLHHPLGPLQGLGKGTLLATAYRPTASTGRKMNLQLSRILVRARAGLEEGKTAAGHGRLPDRGGFCSQACGLHGVNDDVAGRGSLIFKQMTRKGRGSL